VVLAALLAATAPRHLTGLRHCRKAAALSRLLRVRAQRPAPRQGPPRRPHRSPGEIGWTNTPEPEKSHPKYAIIPYTAPPPIIRHRKMELGRIQPCGMVPTGTIRCSWAALDPELESNLAPVAMLSNFGLARKFRASHEWKGIAPSCGYPSRRPSTCRPWPGSRSPASGRTSHSGSYCMK
jgi:hypothetical protein